MEELCQDFFGNKNEMIIWERPFFVTCFISSNSVSEPVARSRGTFMNRRIQDAVHISMLSTHGTILALPFANISFRPDIHTHREHTWLLACTLLV
jgi:hypothetical protein